MYNASDPGSAINNVAGFTTSGGPVAPAPGTPGVAQGPINTNLGNFTISGHSSGSVLPGTMQAAPDPYAQWGGRGGYDNLINQFNSQKDNIYSTANEAAANQGKNVYGSSILDFLDSQKQGQRGIDAKAVNNELAKKQGVQGVLGMVGRGIKSGGVMLANKNAGDSSAAGAIAGAYGQLGRSQMGNVGNQYEAGNRDIANQQQMFAEQQASGLRHLSENKDQIVNKIVGDAQAQLAALDGQIAGASLPNRIQMEQEKTNIRNAALGQLQQFDAQLNTGVAGIKATTGDERRTAAQQALSAGTDLGKNAFNYTTEAPAQFQNGPFASALPIFTYRGKDQAPVGA